jgi:hypothetical protein
VRLAAPAGGEDASKREASFLKDAGKELAGKQRDYKKVSAGVEARPLDYSMGTLGSF